jgi:hypothetical protein
LLSSDNQQAVGDSIKRRDDLNRGRDVKVIVSSLHDTFPVYSRKQLDNHYHNTLKAKDDDIKRMKGESSSARRTAAINEWDQRYWFMTVKHIRQQVCIPQSKGEYQGIIQEHKGKTYEALRLHFIFGCDEEPIQASIHGDYLVGRKKKKIHLINTDDCRQSSTALRCGNAAGIKGPSLYILQGQEAEKHIDTPFLERNGAPRGSMYTVNPSAYMTDATWDACVGEWCKALRASDPVVASNPDWWVELHVDGFHSKVNTATGTHE